MQFLKDGEVGSIIKPLWIGENQIKNPCPELDHCLDEILSLLVCLAYDLETFQNLRVLVVQNNSEHMIDISWPRNRLAQNSKCIQLMVMAGTLQ